MLLTINQVYCQPWGESQVLQIFTWSKELYENITKRQRYNGFSEGKNYNPMKHCKIHDQIKNRKTDCSHLGPSLNPNISKESYLLAFPSISMSVDIYAFGRCFGSDLQGIHAFRTLAFLVPCFMGTQLHKPIFWDWAMLNDPSLLQLI